MKSILVRGMPCLAVALFLLPCSLRADDMPGSLRIDAGAVGGSRHDQYSTSFTSSNVVDDMVELNSQNTGRRVRSTEVENSASTSEAASAPASDNTEFESVSVNEEQRWVLGMFGAMFVFGLGITSAGIYFSGPRGFSRRRW